MCTWTLQYCVPCDGKIPIYLDRAIDLECTGVRIYLDCADWNVAVLYLHYQITDFLVVTSAAHVTAIVVVCMPAKSLVAFEGRMIVRHYYTT